MIGRPPRSTLFPYTTLSRSLAAGTAGDVVEGPWVEDRFRAGFPLIRVEGKFIRAADVDLRLRGRPKGKRHLRHRSVGDRPGRTAPPTVRLVSQIDGDVGRAAAGPHPAVLVMELRRRQREASCLAHHPAGGADSPGARRPVELRSQVGGEVDLIPVEKAPGRAAHGAVQDGGDHFAVNDPAVAGRGRGIWGRVPLADGASGLEFRPPPAERIPDARLPWRGL